MSRPSRPRRAIVNPATANVINQVTRCEVTPHAQDGVLVMRAQRGDREAFELLYHRYKHDVWSLAVFTLHDRDDAEDGVQETFLRAYRSLDRFRRRDAVRPWLLTICRNVCLDRLRAGRRRPADSLDDDGVAEPVAAAIDQDRRIDARAAFAQLPAPERAAFLVVDVLGCSSGEAARVLHVRAASTLRSRLARARRELARTLADPAGEEAIAAASSEPGTESTPYVRARPA